MSVETARSADGHIAAISLYCSTYKGTHIFLAAIIVMGDRRDLRLSFQVGSNLCQKMWRVQSKIPASHRLSTDDFHVVLNIHYKSVSPLAHGLRIVKLLRHTSIKYVSIYYLAKTCGCCECLPHKRGYHKLGEQTVKECLVFMFHDNLFGLW